MIPSNTLRMKGARFFNIPCGRWKINNSPLLLFWHNYAVPNVEYVVDEEEHHQVQPYQLVNTATPSERKLNRAIGILLALFNLSRTRIEVGQLGFSVT